MEVHSLRYFLAVAQEQNISRAAKYLHISQPALSRQISELEKELGVQLFDRSYHTIKLTNDGYYLRDHAQQIIALVDKTTSALQANHLLISGELDIGCGESLGMRHVMQVIGQIMDEYPAVKIHLHSGDAMEVEKQLATGNLDFGVIMGEYNFHNYQTLQLPEKNYWGILMAANSPLAQKQFVTPADLNQQKLIISEQVQHSSHLQTWWQDVAEQIQIVGTYNLAFNAALLAHNPHYLVLAFEDVVQNYHDGLVFRRLQPQLAENNTLIWQPNRTMTNLAQLFLKRLQTNLTPTTNPS